MTDRRWFDRKLVDTDDGSHSIYLPALDEHYHSSYGAVRESRHVFIGNGYDVVVAGRKSVLRVLEIGFGTGLNALLTWERACCASVTVIYTALEPFPVEEGTALQLNHATYVSTTAAREASTAMHRCPWGVNEAIGATFGLVKLKVCFEDFEAVGEYDLVYHDAFSPIVQPELWTPAVFDKLFRCMSAGAVLVTYCAKGEVRRNLRSAGFSVERLAGPPGKREMTRARKL